MKSLDDIFRTGGVIDLSGGFLKRTFELASSGEPVARLAWEDTPPGKAYFDTATVRYELEAVARSHLTRRRTVEARRGGEVVAELHTGWRGATGDAISSVGHRYVFSKVKGRYELEREVGHERVCEVSWRSLKRGRQVRIHAGGGSTEEEVAVVVALLFHILAMDYATDRRIMVAGGAAAGG
jgi:hypothetical protein